MEPWSYTLNLHELDLPHLDLSQLEELFIMEEVKSVIKDMPPDKAPGPDGTRADSMPRVGAS